MRKFYRAAVLQYITDPRLEVLLFGKNNKYFLISEEIIDRMTVYTTLKDEVKKHSGLEIWIKPLDSLERLEHYYIFGNAEFKMITYYARIIGGKLKLSKKFNHHKWISDVSELEGMIMPFKHLKQVKRGLLSLLEMEKIYKTTDSSEIYDKRNVLARKMQY